MNQTELIKQYISIPTDDCQFNNVKVEKGMFYHYWTPMIEKYNDKYIVNITKYSDVTRFLQKKIKAIIGDKNIIEVKGVPENYKGRLKDFLK